jgi:hypothetical protein
MPARWPRAPSAAAGLLAAALLLAGLGVVLIAWDLPDQPFRVAGDDQPINASATDPADVTTHNSPAVAADPTDAAGLAVASRIDGPQAGCAVHVSTDGGASWQRTDVPLPDAEPADGDGEGATSRADGAGDAGAGQRACFAPDVAFGPQGRLYVAFTVIAGLRNATRGAWVAASTDGGETFSDPTRVATGRPFQVSVAADPTQPDRVYLAWLAATAKPDPWGFAETDNPIRVARSDDAGGSWTSPTRVDAAAHTRALAPSIEVGADGRVALAYLDLAGDAMDYQGGHDGQGGPAYDGHWSLALARSGDAGQRWQQATVTDELVPRRRIIAFFAPTPALALTGEHTYVAFHDARRGGADVWLWTRRGGQAGFGEPTRVNDTGLQETTAQYLPQLAATPDGARLDVAYYDRRDDPDNVFTHTSWQTTPTDGEPDFTAARRLSDAAFDARIGPGSQRNLATLGSQLGLTATSQRSTAVWADTRAAPQAAAKQDLATARVVHSGAASWRLTLLAVGLVAAVAGAIVAVRWVVARREAA